MKHLKGERKKSLSNSSPTSELKHFQNDPEGRYQRIPEELLEDHIPPLLPIYLSLLSSPTNTYFMHQTDIFFFDEPMSLKFALKTHQHFGDWKQLLKRDQTPSKAELKIGIHSRIDGTKRREGECSHSSFTFCRHACSNVTEQSILGLRAHVDDGGVLWILVLHVPLYSICVS